jgi:hypothetical protein
LLQSTSCVKLKLLLVLSCSFIVTAQALCHAAMHILGDM